jgi:hypothetical protein
VNVAGGLRSGVGGGGGNQATGEGSRVGGGTFNLASGSHSVIAGGTGNEASGAGGAIAGGSGNEASGQSSLVAGGTQNHAGGDYSFAAGRRAKALANGSFVWCDSQDFDCTVQTVNRFGVRASGGVRFTVNAGPIPTQYCDLEPGVVGWSCVSDRGAKENFAPVDTRAVLDGLVAMPLSTWNFKGSDRSLRMMGPTAQDFRAAFRLGPDDEATIASGNLDGVALAAVQGLNAKLEDLLAASRSEIELLRQEVGALRDDRLRRDAQLAAMRAEIDKLQWIRDDVAALQAMVRGSADANPQRPAGDLR